MYLSKKTIHNIIISLKIIIVTGILLTLLIISYPSMLIFTIVQQSQRAQIRLLCKTDHQALLEACREVSREVKEGKLKPDRHFIRFDPEPEVLRLLPQEILDIKPSYIYIDELDCGRVMLEMLGGLGHFGVEAYTEDFMKANPDFEYHDRKLIDGLWYYDDGYNENPDYAKRIEKLIRKNKQQDN